MAVLDGGRAIEATETMKERLARSERLSFVIGNRWNSINGIGRRVTEMCSSWSRWRADADRGRARRAGKEHRSLPSGGQSTEYCPAYITIIITYKYYNSTANTQ